MTMLKQAAQAVAVQRRADEAAAGLPAMNADEPPLPLDYRAVRAVLRSIRTPSHEITAAVVKPGADRSQAVIDFRAMIDAILEEKP